MSPAIKELTMNPDEHAEELDLEVTETDEAEQIDADVHLSTCSIDVRSAGTLETYEDY